MTTICGQGYFIECPKYKHSCEGCQETKGRPYGGNCVAANLIIKGGMELFNSKKKEYVDLINSFQIKGLRIEDLNLLNGDYINLEYDLDNGSSFRLLNFRDVYFANQVEIKNSDLCYGVAINEDIVVISKYGTNGINPQLILYKKLL